jgi:hypothetical protein
MYFRIHELSFTPDGRSGAFTAQTAQFLYTSEIIERYPNSVIPY